MPAALVSNGAGEYLKKHAKGQDGECCAIYLTGDWLSRVRALTEEILLFICISVAIVTVFRCFVSLLRKWYRRWMRTLHNKVVEELPRFAFGAARLSGRSVGETCAICLGDYENGDILTILPCQHYFHASCVDSWLTKWGTACPVCRLEVCGANRVNCLC